MWGVRGPGWHVAHNTDMEADGLQRPEVRTSAPDGPAGAAHLLLERGLHVHRPHWLGRFLFQAGVHLPALNLCFPFPLAD